MALNDAVMLFLEKHPEIEKVQDDDLGSMLTRDSPMRNIMAVPLSDTETGNSDFYLHPSIFSQQGRVSTIIGEEGYGYLLKKTGVIHSKLPLLASLMSEKDYGIPGSGQFAFYKMPEEAYNSILILPYMNLDLSESRQYKFVQVRLRGEDYIYLSPIAERAPEHREILAEFLTGQEVEFDTEESSLSMKKTRPKMTGQMYELIGAGSCQYNKGKKRLAVTNEKSSEYNIGPDKAAFDRVIETANMHLQGSGISLMYF